MASSTASTPTRKTTRPKKPSLKALESLYISKLKTSGFVADPSTSDEENLREFLSSDEEIEVEVEKPKLIHENDLVRGEDIFAFQSRKQRDSLAQKVVEACSQKTPYHVRNKMKNKISAKVLEYSSGSEYECSTSEESSDSEDTASQSDSQEETEKNVKKRATVAKFSSANLQGNVKKTQQNYTIKTEEYFANYASSKIKTSNNTLDKLETPRLPQYELQKLLSKTKLSKEHEKAISKLENLNKSYYKKWMYLLHENFNVLLYGLGSKRNLINSFHKECLNDLPVIVVNGFFPTLSVKNILDPIIVDLLQIKENPSNLNEACELISHEFEAIPETHLYLIIHNIEGDSLRNHKTQHILARLAAVKNIHLIASIDHINAPLIWDHSKLSKFNFVWYDVTTYSSYKEETSFEKSMMVQQSGALALSSLKNVFLALTTNSKAIYLKIVKYQLENSSQYYQGISFKELYMACREAFIVSTDLALRAQLTEFIDHKMVKLKRSADGTEYLTIPLANNLLQKFYDENV